MDIEALVHAWEVFLSQRGGGERVDSEYYLKIVNRLAERGLPPIFDLQHLAALVGVESGVIASQAAHPASNYRQYQMPKRSGGVREIDVPNPPLMNTQRWVLENILAKLPVHDAAHGFVHSRSVITNACAHAGAERALRLDILDFFPSISLKRGISVFVRAGYPARVAYLLACICYLNNSLPQGAPTSPQLSNLVSRRLDLRLSELARTEGLTYSRYADDLVFSGGKIPLEIMLACRKIAITEGFQINEKKTRFMKRGRKMVVAGVSISSGRPTLPRASVRKIKAECHWILKYGVENHFRKTGDRDPIILERLLGRIGFWLQIEPDNPAALNLSAAIKEYGGSLAS